MANNFGHQLSLLFCNFINPSSLLHGTIQSFCQTLSIQESARLKSNQLIVDTLKSCVFTYLLDKKSFHQTILY